MKEVIPQCLRSGFCCKQAPCPFGEMDPAKKQCKHLKGEMPGEYICGIYYEIIKDPSSSISPAFGTGCGSTMFNEDRDKLRRVRNGQ